MLISMERTTCNYAISVQWVFWFFLFPAFLSNYCKNRQRFANESLILKFHKFFSWGAIVCWQHQWRMHGSWYRLSVEIWFICIIYIDDKSHITYFPPSAPKAAWMHMWSMHGPVCSNSLVCVELALSWSWCLALTSSPEVQCFIPCSRYLYLKGAIGSGYQQAKKNNVPHRRQVLKLHFYSFWDNHGIKAKTLFITWSWIHLVRIITFNYLQGKEVWLLLTQMDMWAVTLCWGDTSTDSTQRKINTLDSKHQEEKFYFTCICD